MMRRARFHPFVIVALIWACAGVAACGSEPSAPPQTGWLSAGETVAPGVTFHTSTDATLVEPAASIHVSLLRLDPLRARLTSLLSHDQVMYAEPVREMAERSRAVAAVNAGFFNVNNGEPVGLLKVAGLLVSDTPVTKGAVGIWSPLDGRTELAFDQISARVDLRIGANEAAVAMAVDGVDTTRERGKLMLYTPKYHPHTDTADNGVEWVLQGTPLRVVAVRTDLGSTEIPADGFVLSYGGLTLPAELALLQPETPVTLETHWRTINGLEPSRIDTADHVVNGAGLLRVRGRQVTDWDVERLSRSNFVEMRHPRTMIGVDRRGDIWLAVVDGRQSHSVGMAFSDLQRLGDRLQLTDALNLDGGGSTTMVVRGKVVNRPSDAKGPRSVSDAIGVTVR
jgi:hypothetical protein